jgi:hypothetical protein
MPPGSKRLRREPDPLSVQATKDSGLQALRETGATGLEPATSGVTGRFADPDDWRRWTWNRSIHAAFWAFHDSIPQG